MAQALVPGDVLQRRDSSVVGYGRREVAVQAEMNMSPQQRVVVDDLAYMEYGAH